MDRYRKSLYLLFYLMLAFALLGPTFGFSLTEGFRLTFFRILFGLLLVGVTIHFLRERSISESHLSPVRPYLFFFALWFAYGVVSLTWAVNIGDGVRYLVFLGMMLLLTLSLPFFLQVRHRYWLACRLLWGVCVGIIFYGVFESITLIHLPSSRVFASTAASVTSVFTNQNDLATFVTICLPFLITALFMLELRRRYKIWIYITCVMGLYILVATGSRSNTVLALPLILLTLAILVPFVVDRAKITWKNLGQAFVAVILAIVVVGMMAVTFLSDTARNIAKSKLESTFGMFLDIHDTSWDLSEEDDEVIQGETGESATVRKYLILNGFRFLHDSHYLGVGAGNVETHMKGAPRVNKVNMHNWWMEILVNFGVVVFAAYVILYGWLLQRLWRIAHIRSSHRIQPMIRWGATACLVSLIGYIFGSIAPSTAIHYTPMWICYGLALATILLGEKMHVSST